MGMLLLNGSSEFGVRRELFANNEQGLWLDPSDMNATKAGWRRNLLTYSEGTASQYGITSGISTASTPISGFANSVQFGDNSSLRYCYDGYTTIVGSQYTLSVYVQMDDNSVPSVGASAAEGDFTLVALSNIISGVTVTQISGSLYRISKTLTGDGASKNFGIVKYTGQSAKTFRVTGYQLELGSLSEYQRITDFSTEFKEAFPTHTLYQDSNGVTPCTAAGDPVGLILDQSRGGLGALGPELMTNGGFTSDSNWVKGTSAVIANGYLEQPTGTGSFSYQVFPTQAGKWYRVTFDILQGTFYAGVWSVAPTGTILGGGNSYTPSSRVIWFIANDNDAAFSFVCNEGIGRIDNISVREVPGNHAYQTTSASRPTLARIPSCGRRNLITYTEQMDNAAWQKVNGGIASVPVVTPNQAPNPLNGEMTADLVVFNLNGGTSSSEISMIGFTNFVSAEYTTSFYAKTSDGSTKAMVFVGAAGVVVPVTITGNWQRFSTTGTGVGAPRLRLRGSGSGETTADSASIHLFGWQHELGSSATNYQKVTATTDVTESGVNDLWHLVFDGSDDSLLTNAVDFATWTQETRRNLLSQTEDFSGWANTFSGATVTPNTTADPVGGGNSADTISFGVSDYRYIMTNIGSSITGKTYTFSCWVASLTGKAKIGVAIVNSSTGSRATNLVTLTNTLTRVSVTKTFSDAGNLIDVGFDNRAAYGGDGIAGDIIVWGAQLEEAASMSAYQRVGTDEMTVIAGVRKLQNSSTAMIAELSVTSSSNNGAFWVLDGDKSGGGANKLSWRSRGTTGSTCEGAVAINSSVVFTGSGDISGDVSVQRINAIETESNVTDQGTGNYGNHVLYIGRRASSSLPFNGHLYQLIIRGKTTPTGKLFEAEKFVSKKTGVNL